MVLNTFIFALITWGLMMLIALMVAAIIKGISFFVQRGGKKAPPPAPRQS
jgi:hypothetical protein